MLRSSASNPLHRKLFPEKLRRFSTSIHARAFASIFGVGVTFFGAYAAYQVEKDPENEQQVIVSITEDSRAITRPPEARHPYEKESLVWKTLFKIHRILYFCVLFAPCVFGGILCKLTEDPSLREAWIRLLVKTIEMGGSSCMKFGQWISMRPDVIAGDIIQALASLRQDAPSHSFAHTRQQIEKSLGKTVDEIFDEISELPVASGTIAQVHRAKLRQKYALRGHDGRYIRDVAVKVQHPHVIKETFIDIDILFQGLNLIFAVPFSKEEFVSAMQRQINFEWEAYNLWKFKKNFRREITEGEIIFPAVSRELLAPQVLIEGWVNGHTISELFDGRNPNTTNAKGPDFTEKKSDTDVMKERSKFSKLKQYKDKMGAWAKTLFRANAKMFLKDNFVHGDMHAGNVMVSEEYPDSIVVIDAGCTCEMQAEVLPKFESFVSAMCEGDTDSVAETLIDLNEMKESTTNAKLSKFRREISTTVKKFVGSPGRDPEGNPVRIGALLTAVLKELQKHDMVLRSDFAMSLVTLGLTEGIIKQLDPTFDCVKSVMGFMLGEHAKDMQYSKLPNVLGQW